jgi:DNA-binding NarL/FixJ family response regulator
MIRVLVADGHAVVAEGLSRVLADELDLEVCDPVTCAEDAVSHAVEPGADVVVMDAHTLADAGRAIGRIRDRARSTRVVVLASQPEVAGAIDALRAGASGYVSKRAHAQELVHAIRHCAAGRRYVEPSLANAVLAALLDPSRGGDPMARLSAREQDIVRFLVQGRRKVDIAREMSLSPKTIETYRARAMGKLGLRDLPGLVRFAIRRGIVPLD